MLPFRIDDGWSLFLDRDGVINERIFGGYITHPKDFKFLIGAIEGLQRLTKKFSHTFIVTNQQGVGKGIMTDQELKIIHDFMLLSLEKKGVFIDEIYVATNLKNAYNDRRKPLKNMGMEAKKKFPNIDFNKAIMVGDTSSDILFGMKLGMKTVGVRSEEQFTVSPDILVSNLNELADELEL